MAPVPKHHRILTCDGRESEFPANTMENLSVDTVFQFLNEECEGLSSASSIDYDDGDDGENQTGNESRGAEEEKFWKTQHQLLESTICRTSSLESRILKLTKEALKDIQQSGGVCLCGRPAVRDCRKCLMGEICRRLQNAGFDSAICKSKWKSSHDIPSGEHVFLDVMDTSNPKKEVRVIIELNFRAQFEMARANEEYNNLISRLPEIFVGNMERLLAVLKIVCGAAKRCMKAKNMHMAPWRKLRYMQAKWHRTCERLASSQAFSPGRPARPGRSLLTVELMESLSSLHRSVVAVV